MHGQGYGVGGAASHGGGNGGGGASARGSGGGGGNGSGNGRYQQGNKGQPYHPYQYQYQQGAFYPQQPILPPPYGYHPPFHSGGAGAAVGAGAGGYLGGPQHQQQHAHLPYPIMAMGPPQHNVGAYPSPYSLAPISPPPMPGVGTHGLPESMAQISLGTPAVDPASTAGPPPPPPPAPASHAGSGSIDHAGPSSQPLSPQPGHAHPMVGPAPVGVMPGMYGTLPTSPVMINPMAAMSMGMGMGVGVGVGMGMAYGGNGGGNGANGPPLAPMTMANAGGAPRPSIGQVTGPYPMQGGMAGPPIQYPSMGSSYGYPAQGPQGAALGSANVPSPAPALPLSARFPPLPRRPATPAPEPGGGASNSNAQDQPSPTSEASAEAWKEHAKELRAALDAYRARDEAWALRMEAIGFEPARAYVAAVMESRASANQGVKAGNRGEHEGQQATPKIEQEPHSTSGDGGVKPDAVGKDNTTAASTGTEDEADVRAAVAKRGFAPVLGLRLLQRIHKLERENSELHDLVTQRLQLTDDGPAPRGKGKAPNSTGESASTGTTIDVARTKATVELLENELQDAHALIAALSSALKAAESSSSA